VIFKVKQLFKNARTIVLATTRVIFYIPCYLLDFPLFNSVSYLINEFQINTTFGQKLSSKSESVFTKSILPVSVKLVKENELLRLTVDTVGKVLKRVLVYGFRTLVISRINLYF